MKTKKQLNMKSNFFILSFLLFLGSTPTFSQVKDFTRDEFIKDRLGKVKDKLVSNDTFNDIISKDFASIQTGDKNKSVVGEYAALDINTKEKSFAFAPYVYNRGNVFFSADFTGKLSNDESFFNWKNRSNVKIDVNVTWLFKSWKNFKEKKPDSVYADLYGKIYDKVDKKIKLKKQSQADNKETPPTYESQLQLDDLTLNTPVTYSKIDSLTKYVKKYEAILAGQTWTSKTMFWTKFNLIPLSNDNFYYLIKSDSATFSNPSKKSINMFSLQGSINGYRESKNYILYGSFYIKGTRKHSLSEIYETKQWNKIRSLGESNFISEESKNVYELDEDRFSRLFLFDYGIHLITIFKKLNFGIEVKYDNTKFIKPNTSNDASYIDAFALGVVIPLKDKDGKTSINIIPFYEHKQYVGYEKISENIAGIKFSVPFGQ